MDNDTLTERLAKLSPSRRALLEFRLKERNVNVCGQQSIPRRESRDSARLSFAQQRLWFLNQLDPESPAYNEPKAILLKGALNVRALGEAINHLVARHEALRTMFASTDGNLRQIIVSDYSIELPVVDLSSLPQATRDAEVDRLISETTQRPFDLIHDLMLRALLIRLSNDEEHVLLFVTHHIASDKWSSGILWRDLAALYQSFVAGHPCTLPELPVQYADYAEWQHDRLRGDFLETQLGYWKKQLAGISTLRLLADRPNPQLQSWRGAKESFSASREVSDALAALSRQHGVTLFMTLLAAFQTLLQRYTGQDDIAVGSPIAGRTRSEIENLIGFFINTLVLRTDLSGNPTFVELLGRVRETAYGAYAHQELPFEKLVEELNPERNLSGTPLFRVMFALQNVPQETVQFPGLSVIRFDINREVAKFDLSLSILEEPEGLKVSFEYNTDLSDAATITRMLGHFKTLLESIVANPDQCISDLPILLEAENHQLLVEWNDTKTDYPEGRCLHQLFETQVQRTPDSIAAVFEDQRLTYRGLNARANQLAHYLRKLGVGPEVLVGLCAERSLDMVIGLLGILKAGGAYLPLDPDYPKERLAFMLQDAQVPVLLTQAKLVERLPRQAAEVVCLDMGWDEIATESSENPADSVMPDNLAYVIYTSGSTGSPKGAMNTHRGICNRLLWMQDAYRLMEADRVLQKTPFSFDVSVWEFFWPLLTGARLVVARPGGHQDSAYLVKLISEQKITTLHFVPSMLQVFLSEPTLEACRCLRQVMCSGETLPTTLQELFFARLGAELHNLYGPTEAAVDVTFWACERSRRARAVPIGRPIANIEIYLLDSHLKPVPVGVPGELFIGGVGLARGYLNQPELTTEKFIPNSFSDEPGARLYKTGDVARYLPDGNIEFLGRVDHQVKIRGFRIELGEIEVVLSQHPAVRETVVLAREDGRGEKRLVGYIVTVATPAPSTSELRSFLQHKLPNYMVPAAFVFLDSLPVTSSGKVDRNALPEPDQNRLETEESYVAPRTPVEELLAGIWSDLLKIAKVGARDNFFDLGGHSLLATQVISRIRITFRIDLPLRRLFETPTVAGLARAIQEMETSKGASDKVALLHQFVAKMSPEEVARRLEEKRKKSVIT